MNALYHFYHTCKILGSENTFKNMANESIHDNEVPAHSNLSFRQIIHKQITNGNYNKNQFAKKDMDHITKDTLTFTTMGQQKKNSVSTTENNLEKIHSTNNINKGSIDDDTINLFQNVIREVVSWKSKSELNPNKLFTPIIETNKCHQNEHRLSKDDQAHKFQNTELRTHPKNYLRFADFSREFDVKKELSVSLNTNKYFCETGQMSNPFLNFTKESDNLVPTRFKMKVRKTASAFQYPKEKHSEIDLRGFKPTIVSTPKRQHQNENSSIHSKLQNTTKISYVSREIRLCRSRINKQHKTNKSKITQTTPDTTKDVKQRSMSARLFSAINDSCTTLVKSVKSIFTSHYNKNKNVEADSCSYSFTNYMRKRDAALGNEETQTKNLEYDDFNSMYRDSCRTCKDTMVLQHKMATDEHLQQIVKRLKIGVHLYGCNFKVVNETNILKHYIIYYYIL